MLGRSEVARSLGRPHVVRIKETADNVYGKIRVYSSIHPKGKSSTSSELPQQFPHGAIIETVGSFRPSS